MDYQPTYPKTKKGLREDLIRILREKDLIEFAKYCTITQKDGTPFSFSYDRWFPSQKEFHHNQTGKDICTKGRQIGMTRYNLVRNLFYALVNPNTSVMVLARDQSDAKDFMLTMKDVYDGLVDLGNAAGIPELFPPRNSPKLINQKERFRLSNGSTILVQTAGASSYTADGAARGKTINRLHCSESAFWKAPSETMRAAFQAIPKLPSSEVVIESTPNGFGNWFQRFYYRALDGANGYKAHFFPWYEHPEHKETPTGDENFVPQNTTEKRLKNELNLPLERLLFFRYRTEELGSESQALKEYPIDEHAGFVASDSQFLTPEENSYLSSILAAPIDTLDIDGQELLIYEQPQPNAKYVIGADVSGGVGGSSDNSALVVLNKATAQIAAVFATNIQIPKIWGETLARVGSLYNTAETAVESNSMGIAAIDSLKAQKYPKIYNARPKTGLPGWKTNSATRPTIFQALKEAIHDEVFESMDPQLFRELRNLQVDSNGRIEATNKKNRKGTKDDLVMALAIALFVRSQVKKPLTKRSFHVLKTNRTERYY